MALEVALGMDEYNCDIALANVTFANILRDSSDDFDAITSFACREGCYPGMVTCQNNLSSCAESLSCDCATNFLSVVVDLSPVLVTSLDKLNTTTLGQINAAACCDDFNGQAADLMNEGYCSLQEVIVREGSIFAGNATQIRSSCPERSSCVGNVTETLARMSDMGCDIRQKSDDAAKFLFYLNNSSDIGAIMNFICGVGGDCYDAVGDFVETCSRDPTEECTKLAPQDCFRSFLVMVNSMSDEGGDVFFGFDSSKSFHSFIDTVNSIPVDEISYAPRHWFHASTAVIVCISIMRHMFLF
jgi:hypothetical protein